MVPGLGMWSPAADNCLRYLSVLSLSIMVFQPHLLFLETWGLPTYPLFTPSTCRSTHHTPGMLSISHSAPYLIALPIGTNSSTAKYSIDTLSRSGRRKKKRVIDTGAQKRLNGAGGTGRKGAIAVPGTYCQLHNRIGYSARSYLYRGTGCTSPWRRIFRAWCHRDM